MTAEYDIVVVGSGFAGSLLAMIARRAGRSVLMLEKGRHPRFAIGESSTALSNLLLEELAARYDLPRLKPLTKWGTWQQSYPQLACGLTLVLGCTTPTPLDHMPSLFMGKWP